jgi:hypothetical protein
MVEDCLVPFKRFAPRHKPRAVGLHAVATAWHAQAAMTEKLTLDEIPENSARPATQGDLAIWGGRLQEQIDELRRGQRAILDVVKSIDERLQRWGDLPARIERLERATFGSR